MTEYPFFIPPDDLSALERRTWTREQAERYRDWLVSVLPERTDHLLLYFGESDVGGPEILLGQIGTKAVDALYAAEFSQAGSPARKLTDRGYALAADLGLLVARLLLGRYPGTVKWSIQRKPKSDIAYNLPVLTGFTAPAPLEPVGGSIAEAHAVLRGNRDARAWADMFTYWAARVPG